MSAVLLPDSVGLLVANWLVEFVNINSGVPYTLPEIKSDKTDKLIGLSLVVLALIHNIGNRYIKRGSPVSKDEKSLIPDGDWGMVKEDILTNLRCDEIKLQELLLRLEDASHVETIDPKYKLEASQDSLMDRNRHLQSTPISKIENREEIELICNWYVIRKEINNQLSMIRRVEYVSENAQVVKKSLKNLVKFYENA